MKHFLPIIVALLLMSNCYAGSGSLVRGMISGALVAAQIIGLAVLLIRYSNKRGRLLALPLALLIAPACHAGMGRNILKGATDQSTRIRILNDDGTPSTDVVAATSGLDLEYVRNGAAPVDLTESDLAATNSAHSDGGIKHLGGGVYRVDPPDAAFASGVDEVSIQGTCTDRVIVGVSHQLVEMPLSNAATFLAQYITKDTGTTSDSAVSGSVAQETKDLIIDEAEDGETMVQNAMTAQGYTEARAAKIDNADAAVSSRLASGSYTAPDNSTIGTINSKLGGITGSGTNTVLGYFRAMMAKASGLTPTDISSGTSFNNVTDSQEGNRDNVGTAGAGLTEVSGGGGGSITIPVNQVPVPLSRTWSIVRTASTGLKGKLPLSTTESASSNLWAIDFAVDLPTNGRLTDINSVEVISGDEAGLTLGEDTEDADDYGVDKAMAKLRITPTTAGTYVLRVSVDYASADGGGSAVADVTLKVAE